MQKKNPRIRRWEMPEGIAAARNAVLTAALIAALCIVPVLAAYAEETAGPGAVTKSAEEEGRLQKLTDGVLEWDEVDELVTLQAPAWLEISESLHNSATEYKGACELYQERRQEDLDLIDEEIEKTREARRQLRELAYGTIVDDHGTTREEAIRRQEEAERSLRAARQQVTKTIGAYVVPVKSALKKQERDLEPQRKAIVSGIQDMVISYRELCIEGNLMAQTIALEEAQLAAQKTAYRLGLISADALKEEELRLEQVRLEQEQTELSLRKAKKSIASSLGFDEETLLEIGEVPGPDTTFFASIDKETDLKKYFEQSEELEEAQKQFGKYGTRALQDAAINQIKANLVSEYETGYAAVKEAKTAYEEALLSEAEAEKQLGIARERLKEGSISRLSLQAEENTCAEAQAAAELSAMSYKQAIDHYRQMLEDG